MYESDETSVAHAFIVPTPTLLWGFEILCMCRSPINCSYITDFKKKKTGLPEKGKVANAIGRESSLHDKPFLY